MAGWDVPGTIKHGSFFFVVRTGAADGAAWLDEALELPSGRTALLDPRAQAVALGVAPEGIASGVGIVATTYAFFGAEDHEADAKAVYLRFKELREDRGCPSPSRYKTSPGLGMRAKLVTANRAEPYDVLEWAMADTVEQTGRSVRGWVFAANDLDALVFPEDLFGTEPMTVEVAVSHTKPEGMPWGMYVIWIIAQADVVKNSAMR
jgi:hypothetical protein